MTETARVAFGDVVYEPGGCFGPRIQRDFQLVVLVSGDARVTVDKREINLPAGTVTLLGPGRREYFRFSERRSTHHTWCEIRPELVSGKLLHDCEAATGAVLPLTARLAQLMEMGLGLPRSAGSQAPGLVEALGLAALNEVLYVHGNASSPAAHEPDAVRRALEWISQHGLSAFDLRTLAKAAGVSPAQLVKLFKQHLHTTPMRYVWETRTQQGIRLLRDTGLTVSETAWRCGFRTPFHFSRWVRAVAGVSPRELRARSWSASQTKRSPDGGSPLADDTHNRVRIPRARNGERVDSRARRG